MRDSNKSFFDWLEILHLVMNDKKPMSIKSILRQSRQKRYGTVLYMVRKIQKELGKINSKIQYTKISEITFQGDKINSINFPGKLTLCYTISEDRKRDEIRLFLSKTYRVYTRSLKKELLKSKFLFPKLLTNNEEDELAISSCAEQGIKQDWKNKIKGNLFKLLKGIHHEVAWYNLQLILDEYSFKYNRRYSKEWKVDLFMFELTM
ncbi:hypothetical protein [Lishizhenia sp.]|uniref:hypothetical protein n=1 Tax=Lishizhenia sp. TaxID=2497594 RepID=UPI00299F2661|nr:hypothetical protein [Lishizhenia sp.]MDX1446951.1 hypothetical protein [Lishizhenia sp.]